MIPQVIAFVGTKGSGKSTAKNMLVQWLKDDHYKVEEVSFATILKNFLTELTLSTDEFYSAEWKDKHVLIGKGIDCGNLYTPRELMTAVAETCRKFDSDIFVNYVHVQLLKRMKYDEDTVFIIDDIRMESELKMVEQLNGVAIFLNHEPETLYERFRRKLRLEGPALLRNVNPSEYGLKHLYNKNVHFSIDNPKEMGYNNLELKLKQLYKNDFDHYLYHTEIKDGTA